MARIQAGSTLVNQYVPPFVVSNNVTQGWELQWNSTLLAFEAVDPNANTPDAGFDEIQAYSRTLLGAEQRFTLPWAADSKESLIVTIDGVKQHQGAYTASSDTVTNTTILTLAEQVFAQQELEVLGLQTIGGAAVEVYGPISIDSTTLGTVNAYFDLPWLAPSAESLIVTIDGIKQGINNYSVAANSDFTSSRLTFPDRTLTFNIVGNSGNPNISGINSTSEVITTGSDSGRVAHGFTTGQSVYYSLDGGVTDVGLGTTNGVIYYVNAIGAYTISLHTSSADAINDASRVDLTASGAGETHTLTEITDPYLYVNDANYAITGEGINYAIGDIIFIEGGSPVRKAEFRVTDIGDEAQFTIDTDGAGAVSAVTLISGGSGYTNGTGLTITISDATLAGNQDAVIQYDVVGGAVVGPTVFTAGTGYTINQTGVAVDSIDVDNITRAGNVKDVDLNFAGEYVVFPASGLATSTDGSGSGALFNIFAVSPQLEVIGITETGQTPASPVDATNLGAPDDVTTFGLYDSKTLSGDAQILNFKSISEGSNITLNVAGDTVQISADILSLSQSGGGGTSLFDNNDPAAGVLKTVQTANDRIALSTSGTTPNQALVLPYNFGFVNVTSTANGTLGSTARIVHVTHAGPTTVALPAASALPAGETITIKDGNGLAGTHTITISPNGTDQIDNVNADVELTTANAYLTLFSTGTHWHIIGQG